MRKEVVKLKKFCSLSILLICLLLLSACGNSSGKNISIGDIEAALQEKDQSFAFDTEEKPMYQLIGAADGWIGYFEGTHPVKVYQFKDNASYKEALKQYDMMEPWPVVGNFVLETTSPTVEEIFQSLGS